MAITPPPNNTPQSQIKLLDTEAAALGESLGRLTLLGKGETVVEYTITAGGTRECVRLNRQCIAAAIKTRLSQIEQGRALLKSAIDRPAATAIPPRRR